MTAKRWRAVGMSLCLGLCPLLTLARAALAERPAHARAALGVTPAVAACNAFYEGRFTTPEGKVVASLMHAEGSHPYARVRGAQIIELDYRADLSMIVVLPDDVNGVESVEARLAAEYGAWLKALDFKPVDVVLPRWTVTSRVGLSEALAAMGMPTAFTLAANFRGAAQQRPLFIQKVLQQAYVNVDEEGTEAAAVTAVAEGTIGLGRSALPPIPFHADHPFLYLIRDKTTGALLFIGRLVNPAERK